MDLDVPRDWLADLDRDRDLDLERERERESLRDGFVTLGFVLVFLDDVVLDFGVFDLGGGDLERDFFDFDLDTDFTAGFPPPDPESDPDRSGDFERERERDRVFDLDGLGRLIDFDFETVLLPPPASAASGNHQNVMLISRNAFSITLARFPPAITQCLPETTLSGNLLLFSFQCVRNLFISDSSPHIHTPLPLSCNVI